MPDSRVKKLGNLLTNYCVAVQPGDKVALRASFAAMSLLKETYRAVMKAGGHPQIIFRDTDFAEIYLTEAADHQLEYVSPFDKMVMSEFDCLISMGGSNNTRALSKIDPRKTAENGLCQPRAFTNDDAPFRSR